jgi:hypothetical protein
MESCSGTAQPAILSRPAVPGPVVQTNPIPSGRDGARRTDKPNSRPPDGQARARLEPIARNKPNCPKRGTAAVSAAAAFGSSHLSSIPSFHHSSPVPIRCSGILGWRPEKRGFGAPARCVVGTWHVAVWVFGAKTRVMRLYKQTQFAGRRTEAGGTDRAKQSQFPADTE